MNELPEGYEGAKCQHVFALYPHTSKYCGLPAWDGAPEEEPRCPFHSAVSPEDIKEQLEAAVAAGAGLHEADLTDARLFAADLTDAKLHSANLTGAWLDGANLTGAGFFGTNLTGAELNHANLTDAWLNGADLTGVELTYADLTDAKLNGAHLTGADLPGAWLDGANLTDARLNHADLTDARLNGANLTDARLFGADLTDADLPGARLPGADLSGANLTGARLPGADLSGADLKRARFLVLWHFKNKEEGGARMAGVRKAPDLRGVKLHGAKLQGVTIEPECNLEGAKIYPSPGSTTKDQIYEEESNPGEDAQVYRQLKLAVQDSGDYERAGEFFRHERRCLRLQMAQAGGHCLKRVFYFLFEKLAGYGEKPLGGAAWAGFLIVLFAWIQSICGITAKDATLSVGPWRLAWGNWAGLWDYLTGDLWMALYFSAVTFTTLGYGDLAPASGPGRFFAGLEALIGMTLMALFLVCVVRKFSR